MTQPATKNKGVANAGGEVALKGGLRAAQDMPVIIEDRSDGGNRPDKEHDSCEL